MPLASAGRTFGTLSALLFVLSACGGQQGISSVASAQSPAKAAQSKSWMRSNSSSGDLIYATGGCGGTCVLSYPSGQLVGALGTYGSAICSDSRGNIYIPGDDQVIEYAHGGTSPIATYSLVGSGATGCSVDPTTGNLAVVYVGQNSNVAVFPSGGGTPALYRSKIESAYCGYDESGNLFSDGFTGGQPALSELPSGGSTFAVLTISGSVPEPGQLQWDGRYLAWESGGAGKDDTVVARLQVSGSSATVVGIINFSNIRRYATQSWIFGKRIVIPYENNGRRMIPNMVGVWKYPQGGFAVKRFEDFGSYKKKDLEFQGVTFSA